MSASATRLSGALRRYLVDQAWPVAFATRWALTECDTLANAQAWLETVPLVSPCYLALCGVPGQGMVLVRSAYAVEHADHVQTSCSVGGGCVIVINHDEGETPLAGLQDLGLADSEAREAAARKAAARCQGPDCQPLLDLYRDAPVNSAITVMNCVMRPRDNLMLWRVRGQRHLVFKSQFRDRNSPNAGDQGQIDQ